MSGRRRTLALAPDRRAERRTGFARPPTACASRCSIFWRMATAIRSIDARVLDLFAGTGALGIEALSRGAAYVLFVDDGVEARSLLRNNTEALGLGGTSRIFRRDATKLGPVHPLEPFTLAFLDPPYRKGLAEKALDRRARRRLAGQGCAGGGRRSRPTPSSSRRKVTRNWSGGNMTTPNWCFCERL